MKLVVHIAFLSVGMFVFMRTSVQAFNPSLQSRVYNKVALHATSAETDAERLRAKARELMAQVKQQEDDLHKNVMAKKKSQDAHTDQIISELFPSNSEGGTCDLASRLRSKRLAAEVLVQIVERLHQRTRVAEKKEPELASCTDQLIEAAAILDQEFVNHKSKCGDKITHADLVHWGGGNVSGILKDKDKDLAREYDEQFKKRLESFYDAAVKKHTRDEVDSRGWMVSCNSTK
jgi:hypothetical protein